MLVNEDDKYTNILLQILTLLHNLWLYLFWSTTHYLNSKKQNLEYSVSNKNYWSKTAIGFQVQILSIGTNLLMQINADTEKTIQHNNQKMQMNLDHCHIVRLKLLN